MRGLLDQMLLAVALTFCAASALADGPVLATYDGPDRLARIIDAAKREGELTIYTSTPVDDFRVLTDAFERAYGIRTNVWRASSEKVVQRALVEARANRFDADVFETNGPELEALVKEKLLTPVSSPSLEALVAEATPPHRAWAGTRLLVFALAYNTNLVRKEDLPASYDALADPKWRGKLGIEAEDYDWLATVSGLLGEARATALFRRIVEVNGVSVRKGHTLLTNLVASGEVPFALTVYNYKAEQLKTKGAPIDWFVLAPAIARVNGVAVAARAPHPNAALLFYEFELGREGQQLLATRDFVSTRRDIDSPLRRFPLRIVDSKAAVEHAKQWESRFTDIFLRPAK
jgi:iron(III) transport system substrate-binding protein